MTDQMTAASLPTGPATPAGPPGPDFSLRDPWRPGPPLLALSAGWLALFAWGGMVTEPLTFLIPTGMIGLAMALVGSGLRVVRVPPYVVAMVQALVALLGLNLMFAARESLLAVIPTAASIREVFYVIGNGAATLNAYNAPVSVNPTHTSAFLMVCGLGVLFSIDVLAFGLRRPPLVALPLLVTLSVPVSILNDALTLPVFVGTALLFMRLLATEHVEKLWTWGGRRRDTPRPRLGVLWQAAVAAIVVALVVTPFIPVTDLLRPDSGEGTGAGNGNRFELTTINPFVRLRRDLVERTHTPMVYRRHQRPGDRLPAHHRPRPVPQRRVATLAARPPPREQRRRTLPDPTRTGRWRERPDRGLEAAARPQLRHHLAPAALPARRAEGGGQLALRLPHPRRRLRRWRRCRRR